MIIADAPVNSGLQPGGIVLFSIACDAQRLRPVADKRAWREARGIIQHFAGAFPDVEFDISWHIDHLNAQAYRLAERRCVVLYGGLVRHVALGGEGLAVATAHEVGHHKGGAPFHRFYPWLSSDRRADEWAAQVGLPLVFGHDATRVAKAGAAQLFGVLGEASRLQSGTAAIAQCQPDQPCVACRAAIFGVATGSGCTAAN